MTAADSTHEAAVAAVTAFTEFWEREAERDWSFNGAVAGGPTPEDPVLTIDALRALLDERSAVLTRSAELEAENARMREEPEPKLVKYGPTGTGVPATMHLEAFGQTVKQAFGHVAYHVGTSAVSKTGWRDVDVRLMLPDDEFDALFPGYGTAHHIDAFWSLICAAISELGRARTGLPIDFQIQRTSDANEKYPGFRAPLMLITADDEPRPARLAPPQPTHDGEASDR